MNDFLRCRMKAYIQPFERKLALAELASLSNSDPQEAHPNNGGDWEYIVRSKVSAKHLVNRLAYWESVDHKGSHITDQVLREATVNIARNGTSFEQMEWSVELNLPQSIPNRRTLRYGPHGLHEYRGKFFPQLVRALMNIAQVPVGGIVADPMSGSGTTLVEASIMGCRGIGLDMNPMSVLMANTKCSVLGADPKEIIKAYVSLCERLLARSAHSPKQKLEYFSSLPRGDQEYLVRWFSPHALQQLDAISQSISECQSVEIRNLMTLALSNIIRGASWQKAADLRVRKEVKPDSEIHPINDFLEELRRSVNTVVSCIYQLRNAKLGSCDIQPGDARNLADEWKQWRNKVDVIITSPPYATALPYLDTDRLSLSYLGLLTRQEQRKRDQEMIGNREITEKARGDYWRSFDELKDELPASVVKLIQKIERLNSGADVGFRRRNLPVLLTKYFLDMRKVLLGMKEVLKPGGLAYVVVGNNHTIAGGRRVEIATAEMLVEIGSMVGLETGEHIPMEMLVSREIFKKNAVASESILCLRRPKGKSE